MAKQADRYTEFVIEQMSPLGVITSRYMFGGWCLYRDGVVFALIADGQVFLKASDATIPRFQARGLKPFCPFPDKPEMVMKYYEAPPEISKTRPPSSTGVPSHRPSPPRSPNRKNANPDSRYNM